MDEVRATFARAGLVRVQRGRWLAGVAAGLAARLTIDAWIVRLLLVILAFMGGSAVLLYVILWFCMPPVGWIPPARSS